MVSGRETPPSRNLSEGGDSGGVSTEETPPPSCVLSKGGVTENPSISQFERGRGEVVDGRETPPSRILSEGGGEDD